MCSTVLSVHTTTDHVGISKFRRAQKKDMSSLRKDPSKMFPKMRVILNSYDSDSQGTFNEIMELGDHAVDESQSRVSSSLSRRGSMVPRFASMSARVSGSGEKQRIKFKIKSAKESSTNRESLNQVSKKDQK